MAKMKKAEVMSLIVKTMNEADKRNIADEVQAEFDFLIEEYQKDPKAVDGEDIKHFIEVLKREGMLVEATKPTKDTIIENRVKSEKEESEEEMKPVNKSKKTTPKATTSTTKKAETKKVEKIEMKTMEMFLEAFPEELELKDFGKLVIRNDIDTMDKMSTEVENGANLVIVNYWHPRMLKMFDYDPVDICDEVPERFEKNLDVLQPTYCSERVMYAISLYTEVNTTYTPEGFEPDENNLRYNGFINYQVYEMAD